MCGGGGLGNGAGESKGGGVGAGEEEEFALIKHKPDVANWRDRVEKTRTR